MTKFRWLLVTLLALTLLSASGISPASAATTVQARDQFPTSSTAVAPPTTGVLGGGSGGNTDGDPDDIIEGNRLVAVVSGITTQTTSVPARVAVLLAVQVGGVILLLRRLMP